MVLADTGLRAAEICSLTREKVFDDYAIVQGKTGERQVSISPELRDTLLTMVPSGHIFVRGIGSRYRGHPYDTDSLYLVIKKILKRAGINERHMGAHLLRHTHGRQYIAGGGDLVSLQQELGHTQISTTRIYAELSPEESRRRHQKSTPLKQLSFNDLEAGEKND